MFQYPDCQEDWLQIADDFQEKWQFPNCIGALDGKHINLKAPVKSGSLFFNYKGFFSIVLMALADANYKFIYIHVGSYGRQSDGGVWAETDMKVDLEDGTANLPDKRPFPNDDEPMPFTIVADDAFPLKSYLMKPYPHKKLNHDQRIFNYRLSRTRRVVENVFGILSNR